ncbi:MAG: hypothetical protein A2X13_11625 [Bacteroidetes bacterium GWC2_33_15]|nr:MAG: hypothetical protein A2X10_05650 [Bacteroidetes bacterium GWA2_33_15]OFX50787.1 MAG: hypothetical protein A2X13_11625 [Bacteroidetes bacterium GWC2_33_15]OFX62930.1 MAG: hypothetical protein A2X15_09745 [Bacteroidetes bacterium GWB2_32_14]OFX70000.1 MAG: hypothetical protein A2X14_02605 [Bacteroidetes bacterium GWD2_33_33]HAN18996.1 hypothetical protein [Bacteroidales bacterium]
MKVLHIVSTALPLEGGHSIRNHNIFKYLKNKIKNLDVAVSIFEIDEKRLSRNLRFIEDDVNYTQIISKKIIWYLKVFYKSPILNQPLQLFLIFINYLKIKKTFNINEYDIIHGHSGYNNGISAYLIAKKFKKKFIYDLHALSIDNIKKGTLKYKIAKRMESFLIRKAEVLITIDPELKKYIINKYGISEDKIFSTPNGIDSDLFSKNTKLNKEDFAGNGKFVIGIDNSKSIENFQFILKNIDQIIAVFPDVFFVVFGDKNSNLEYDPEYFKFLPKIKFKEMADYYSILDLFIMPRIRNNMTETITPLKILEIMSCEIPVLVSNVNGLSSCVKHSETGYIFNLEKGITSFNDAIKEIRSNKELIKVCKNAREWVVSNKSWENAAEQYVNAYHKIFKKEHLH